MPRKTTAEYFYGCRYVEILRFSMSAIIYYQNPCKLPVSFRCLKAFMHAFSGRFSRASLEGISFNFFVCFIFNVSIGSAPKRKDIDIQRNTRVGLGCQFTSNLLSCHHIFWQKCPFLRPKKWHFEWPKQNFKTTFIVQTLSLIHI